MAYAFQLSKFQAMLINALGESADERQRLGSSFTEDRDNALFAALLEMTNARVIIGPGNELDGALAAVRAALGEAQDTEHRLEDGVVDGSIESADAIQTDMVAAQSAMAQAVEDANRLAIRDLEA
jgi:hypothetical protein